MRHLRIVTTSSGKATALFGGTFDPVHYGHLRSAIEVRDLLDFDCSGFDDFRFLPAGTPVHRSNTVSAASHRLDMLELALAGVPGFSIDERELNRSGPSYMVETLEELRESNRNHPVILILGQDSANSLDTWHRWSEIFKLAHLVIMNRPGDREFYAGPLCEEIESRLVSAPESLFAATSGRVLKVKVSRLSISSSGIREMFREGGNPLFLLPDNVLAYIREHRLYSA